MGRVEQGGGRVAVGGAIARICLVLVASSRSCSSWGIGSATAAESSASSNNVYYPDNDFRVGRNQIPYRVDQLPEEQFIALSHRGDSLHLRNAIRRMLVPRVVGTTGHSQVREFITKSLRDLNWNVELHSFHDVVPIKGRLHFHNIIATLNPNADRYLALACHYDSKYFANFDFIGATDSAVPCAIMVDLAHAFQTELSRMRNATNLSLMLIFFDGEEAFEEWGPNDSIYGARRLAEKWEREQRLDRIDMLVLLDLLGAPDPRFYSFFPKTEMWYSRLVAIEERLSRAGLLERYAISGITSSEKNHQNRFFQPSALRSTGIEDDHIPFIRRNVPCLHVIPVPFPNVWHTEDDNESVIDYLTAEHLARIIRMFTMEYLLGDAANNKKIQEEEAENI